MTQHLTTEIAILGAGVVGLAIAEALANAWSDFGGNMAEASKRHHAELRPYVDQCQAFAHEGAQPFQFGPPCVLARRLVGEHLVHRNLFQLPLRVLVEAADADVTDALTVQGILLREMCQDEIYDLWRPVSNNSRGGSILTFPHRMI